MRVLAILVFAVSATSHHLAAQRPSRATVPRLGQTMQFRPSDGAKVEAVVVRVERDTIVAVARAGDQEYRLGQTQLMNWRVATGTQPAVFRGMGQGALIGTGLGAVIGIVTFSDDCVGDHSCAGMNGAVGASFGVVIGAFLGALVGSMGTSPRWSRVALQGTASASLSADLVPGDGVRIATAGPRPAGVVIGGAGDSARVRLDTGEEISVPTAILERYAGERSRGGKGFLVGGIVGLAYSVIGYAVEDDNFDTTEAVVAIAFGTSSFALLGALVTKGTRPAWSPVGPAAPRLSIAPSFAPGRTGVVASLRF